MKKTLSIITLFIFTLGIIALAQETGVKTAEKIKLTEETKTKTELKTQTKDQTQLKEIIFSLEKIKKHTEGMQVKKVIVIPDKLVNVVCV